MTLMFVPEMKERSERGEDPFDLTIEKWTRIREFSEGVKSEEDFEMMGEAAGLIVPFCIIHKRICKECPLVEICENGEGEKFERVMRIITAYSVAGNLLPREILFSELDSFIVELELVRAKNKGNIH